MAESLQTPIMKLAGGGVDSPRCDSPSTSRFPRWSWMSPCVAVLLLAAALLKIGGLAVETGSARDFFVGPEVLVGFELLLAAWLWSGMFPLACWLTACLTFACFAAASFYMGWIGQASCGCLGAMVTINPWLTFSFDLLVLSTLVISRPLWGVASVAALDSLAVTPPPASRGAFPGHAGQFALGLAGVALLWVILTGLAFALYGSPEAALASIRGERISILPGVVDVGTGAPGELLSATVELANRTDQPVRIVGGTSDCSCIATDDLPMTVSPRQSQSITVKIRLPSTFGLFSRRAMLLTDDPQSGRVSFRLTGRITEATVSQGR